MPELLHSETEGFKWVATEIVDIEIDRVGETPYGIPWDVVEVQIEKTWTVLETYVLPVLLLSAVHIYHSKTDLKAAVKGWIRGVLAPGNRWLSQ